MKKLFTIFVLMNVFLILEAQIIDFEDINFKNKLLESSSDNRIAKNLDDTYFAIDANGNGEIEENEAQQVTWLNISSSNINSINEISYFNNVKYIRCVSNNIETIDLDGLTSLEFFECTWNEVSSIDVSDCINLKTLGCAGNELNEIDVSNLVQLENLSVNYNHISNLDLSANPDLIYLYCTGNNLTTLDVNNKTNLLKLGCSSNDLISLDIRGTPNLDKSDSNQFYFNSSYYSDVEIISVCCDVEDYEDVLYRLNDYEYYSTIVTVGDNCEPPNKNHIKMQLDENLNGCDENDLSITDYSINVTSANQNTDFHFYNSAFSHIYALDNNATITPIINTEIFSVTPNYLDVEYIQGQPIDTLNFCLTPIGEHKELDVSLIPLNDARPGFVADYKIIYKNIGNKTIEFGQLRLTNNYDLMQITSSMPNWDSFTEVDQAWNFNYQNLRPFENREIYFSMQINTPTDTENPVNDEDVLSYNISHFIEYDNITLINGTTLNQTVVNSYDPNDKVLLEGESIIPELVGEYVHYRIRFENTGSANAVNIRVKDEIDTSKFDVSSLKVVDASHEVLTNIESNLVTFNFYNIDLPFDDDNNDGYVVFKIKTIESLTLNDTFSNQAGIYFDYNSPIVTNNYITTISENLSIEDIDNIDTSITIYPHPVHEYFQIKTEEEIQKVEVFDITGKLLKVFMDKHYYNIENLKTGVYLLNVYTHTRMKKMKLLKK